MKKEDEELFKAPRWTIYQPVEVLNIEVKPTKEDEKEIKEFREFIDKMIEEEEAAKNAKKKN